VIGGPIMRSGVATPLLTYVVHFENKNIFFCSEKRRPSCKCGIRRVDSGNGLENDPNVPVSP
jgi:hypothetical protein